MLVNDEKNNEKHESLKKFLIGAKVRKLRFAATLW